ncbi:MAG: hypothetical protein ACRCXA_05845 [Peptostreptococcaceae bacterium]
MKLNPVNKKKINEFYKSKEEAIKEKNLDKAFELSCKQQQEENRKYHINFPFVDSKNIPQKTWENLDTLLKENNIEIVYNEVIKDIQISGLEGTNLESNLVDIHSLSNKCGFPLILNAIQAFVSRIANNNSTTQ